MVIFVHVCRHIHAPKSDIFTSRVQPLFTSTYTYMHQNTHIHGTHRQCLCACADGCTPKGRGSHHNVQDTYIVLYAEQKHENTCWLRICAPRTQVLPHTCMPLRVFMMGMAFRNSGSRQLLLDAAVERDGQHCLAPPRLAPTRPTARPRPPPPAVSSGRVRWLCVMLCLSSVSIFPSVPARETPRRLPGSSKPWILINSLP